MQQKNSKTVAVRPMEKQDIGQVAELEREVFSMPWSEQGFADALDGGHGLFFVACEEERIIGYCGMYGILDEGEITNVAVATEYRGTGVARQLMDALMEAGRAKEIHTLILEVRMSNERAIHFYEKCGFSIAGIRRNFYEKPREDGYVMTFSQ